MENKITFHTNPHEIDSMDDYVFYLEKLIASPLLDITFDVDRNKPTFTIGAAKVDQINGMKLIIHPDEDPPPHFHIISANINAKLAISDCSLIVGNIQGRDLKLVKFWHENGGKQKLITKWDSMRPYECSVGKYYE